MSLTLAAYQRQLMEWRKKYGVPPPVKKLALDVGTSTACVKEGCGSLKRTQRHHKGNDFWFACLLPDAFAPRYIQFLPEDVAYLCEHHHKAVHRVYKTLMKQVYFEYTRIVEAGTSKEALESWARDWIAVFRLKFDKWAKKPALAKRASKRKRRRKRYQRLIKRRQTDA